MRDAISVYRRQVVERFGARVITPAKPDWLKRCEPGSLAKLSPPMMTMPAPISIVCSGV
jgi:hypothetical protein